VVADEPQDLGVITELARHWQAGGLIMEPHPGVFVSTVRTEEWEPDPEVPGSEMHELVHADGVWAGLTNIAEQACKMIGYPSHAGAHRTTSSVHRSCPRALPLTWPFTSALERP
jgi:hypothetical protein